MPLSKARQAARMRVYRAANKEFEKDVRAAVTEQFITAVKKRGITPEELLDEWIAIGTGQVDEPLSWVAKVKALSEMSARLWPVPKEPEKPSGTYNDNRTLILTGFTEEQLRELLGRME